MFEDERLGDANIFEYIWLAHPNSILVAQPLTTNFDVVMGYQTYQNISKHIKQLLLIRRHY